MKVKPFHQKVIYYSIGILIFCLFLPFVMGYVKPLIVLSGSMTPMMLPGDMVIIHPSDPNALNVGDVMAFNDPQDRPNTIITHRIKSINPDGSFETKGDANNAPDIYPVLKSKAIGKVLFVIPLAGYLPGLMRDKRVFVTLILIPTIILLIGEIKMAILQSNPSKARRYERQQKKLLRRTGYYINEKILVLIMITTLIISWCAVSSLSYITNDNTIDNKDKVPLVYVSPVEGKQRTSNWYGIVEPMNKTTVQTHNKVSVVPYVLPVYWIIKFNEVDPLLPMIGEILIYTIGSIVLATPLWYRKKIAGR